jgi:hypothetical protein
VPYLLALLRSKSFNNVIAILPSCYDIEHNPGLWFSLCILVSSTNKTDCHDITEILLKVALNTINHKPNLLYIKIFNLFLFQTRKGDGKTIFDVYASDVSILPIMDFVPKDYGEDGQEFGFEAGPVCFY